MGSTASSASNETLRKLPSVDALLRTETARSIATHAGERHAADLVRRVVDELRSAIVHEQADDVSAEELFDRAETELNNVWLSERLAGTQRVINATGVVIHTNLGRAPLSDEAIKAIADEASGYTSLEYDLASGKRGKRGKHVEELLAELTGAEGVLIVNNCAAAAFFVLTVFAGGGEVVLSRGEMVEIGGDFRVPEVLAQSGAKLREVGTTNRTKLADYEKAIDANTRAILRVHPSNYKIIGFTASPPLKELAGLAHKHDLLIYEDLGSGALIDLSEAGLRDEPVVSDSINAGVDIVSFSGDKLLGGPQAGVIAGKREYIERLRSHPLYRALRVDKLAYAALEATLKAYRRGSGLQDIPVLRMLALSYEELSVRAERFAAQLHNPSLEHQLADGNSAIGGGAAPAVELASKLVALTHQDMTAAGLEQRLRLSQTPVIARIVDERVMIDLRTISERDEAELIEILNSI